MFKVLVLYPKEYTCQSKFDRKVSGITSRMESLGIVFQHDNNALISSYVTSSRQNIKTFQVKNWDVEDITHAIVFDDGSSFADELTILQEGTVPCRKILTRITRVINIKDNAQYKNRESDSEYEYIGRGSYWGNPYSMYEEGDDREEVIRKYKFDFDYNLFPKKDKQTVLELSGKVLGCFCKPELCHGDILADHLNNYDDGE